MYNYLSMNLSIPLPFKASLTVGIIATGGMP